MSEKRYEAVATYDGTDEGLLNEVMSPNGERMGPVECADLLNTQAETIGVLGEWVQEIGRQTSLVELQRHIVRNEHGQYTEKEVSEANRRIAALEGK